MLHGQTMNILTTPKEILLMIFGQLKVPDLVRVSETCHHLKEVARDPLLWKKLTLSYEKIKNNNEACRNHVSRCSSLREIFITGEETVIRSDKIMAVVMKAKNNLTSINLSPSFLLSYTSFKKIGDMTQLTHLDVGGGKLGPGGIASLACLTDLRSLKVPGIMSGNFVSSNNNFTITPMMDALGDLFRTLKKLEVVEIKTSWDYPSDSVVRNLVNNNPNLHHLDISTSRLDIIPNRTFDKLSWRSLSLLANKCPQLTYIGIGNLTMFTSTSITNLVTQCPNLKHANFENTEVDDTALAMMSKNCPELEYLNISGCLSVTEDGLEAFVYPASEANLKYLNIGVQFDFCLFIRLKYDLPNLKIFTEDDEDDLDVDSSDSDEDSSDSNEDSSDSDEDEEDEDEDEGSHM